MVTHKSIKKYCCLSINPALFIVYNISHHYSEVIMSAMASQITSLMLVYSTVYSGPDQRKHRSSASLAFVWGFHWWLVNSLHKGPVMRKMFPFDDVIMYKLVVLCCWYIISCHWNAVQYNMIIHTSLTEYKSVSIHKKHPISRTMGFLLWWFFRKLTKLIMVPHNGTALYHKFLVDLWNIFTHILQDCLTHLPLVPHICISESGQHWFR